MAREEGLINTPQTRCCLFVGAAGWASKWQTPSMFRFSKQNICSTTLQNFAAQGTRRFPHASPNREKKTKAAGGRAPRPLACLQGENVVRGDARDVLFRRVFRREEGERCLPGNHLGTQQKTAAQTAHSRRRARGEQGRQKDDILIHRWKLRTISSQGLCMHQSLTHAGGPRVNFTPSFRFAESTKTEAPLPCRRKKSEDKLTVNL